MMLLKYRKQKWWQSDEPKCGLWWLKLCHAFCTCSHHLTTTELQLPDFTKSFQEGWQTCVLSHSSLLVATGATDLAAHLKIAETQPFHAALIVDLLLLCQALFFCLIAFCFYMLFFYFWFLDFAWRSVCSSDFPAFLTLIFAQRFSVPLLIVSTVNICITSYAIWVWLHPTLSLCCRRHGFTHVKIKCMSLAVNTWS